MIEKVGKIMSWITEQALPGKVRYIYNNHILGVIPLCIYSGFNLISEVMKISYVTMNSNLFMY